MLKNVKLLVIAFFACSILNANAQPGISVNGNIFKFSTFEVYETYASQESWDDLIEMASASEELRTIMKVNPNDTIFPDFLQVILNEDHIVEIGGFLIKIDLLNHRGLAISSSNYNAYNILKDDNIDESGVFIFSEDDDAIEILEKVELGELNSENYKEFLSAERACKGAHERKDKDGQPIIWFTSTTPYSECPDASILLAMDNKVVYQRFIIFFSLQAKIRSVYGCSSTNWVTPPLYPAVDLKLVGNVSYSKRCEEEVGEKKTLTQRGSTLNWRPYNSSRSLSKYKYKATFYIKHSIGFATTYTSSRDYYIEYGY